MSVIKAGEDVFPFVPVFRYIVLRKLDDGLNVELPIATCQGKLGNSSMEASSEPLFRGAELEKPQLPKALCDLLSSDAPTV